MTKSISPTRINMALKNKIKRILRFYFYGGITDDRLRFTPQDIEEDRVGDIVYSRRFINSVINDILEHFEEYGIFDKENNES